MTAACPHCDHTWEPANPVKAKELNAWPSVICPKCGDWGKVVQNQRQRDLRSVEVKAVGG